MALLMYVLVSLNSSSKTQEPVEPEPVEPTVVTEAPAPAEQPTVTPEQPTVTPELQTEAVATEYASYEALLQSRAEEAAASMDLIMRLVVAEAGNQGYDGMRGVAQVIYDRRYNSSYDFGSTFEEIIYADGQFCKPYAGDITPWMPTVAEACWAVFSAGDFVFDEPVHYFYRDDKISQGNRSWFETKKFVGVIGAHTFRSDAG